MTRTHRKSPRRTLFLALLCTLTLILPPASSAGTAPPQNSSVYGMDILGLGWQWVFPRIEAAPRLSGSIRLDLLDSAIHQAADAGVRWNRLSTWWCFVEPERGQFFWDDLDAVIQIGRNYGIETLPVLLYSPYWAVNNAPSGDCINNPRKNYPPTNIADWENFVRAIVRRYGPAGKNVIHYWEIWNEPDLPEFLSVDNDPGDGTVPAYADLLNTAARVIRAEAPGATILIGGLSDIRGYKFLDKLLQLTGSRDIRNSFDVVSFHAYSNHAYKISLIRDVLQQYGLQNRPLWDTELNYMGWDYTQAAQGLAGLFQIIRANGVVRSFWYPSFTSHWGPSIFYPREPEWEPIPFTPTPFYATFRSQTALPQLPSAPTPLGPKMAGAAAAEPLRFQWEVATPGTYPIVGYKLQVDREAFLGVARFGRPELDAWRSDARASFLPLVSGGRASASRWPTWTMAVSSRPAETDPLRSYTPSVPLPLGLHYWRVAAVDSQGNVGPYSEPRSFFLRGSFLSFVPFAGEATWATNYTNGHE
ncbi:MAG: hypothetical protein NT169_21940 [Chloroflexi bacterium]|nr:hypothetical protein [Chloroflexota bacterium]